MKSLKHFLLIKTPPENVYKSLTTTKGVRGWWTLESKTEGEIGGFADFKFGDKYFVKMKIVDLKPNRKVEWECLEGDKEWIGTTFSFELERKDGGTILRFVHDKWKEETDFFASCNYHWGYYLRSIKLYCETGNGTPFTGFAD